VALIKAAGIQAIEWAGDEHVPTGDLKRAAEVAQMCKEEGLSTSTFASYYQCDEDGAGSGPFVHDLGAAAALETAVALEAPAIRVWAGRRGSEEASTSYRETVITCLRNFSEFAARHGLQVHLEYHKNTLTDAPESTVNLLEETRCSNIYTYWQPRHGLGVESCLRDLKMLAPWLSHLHVFHWTPSNEGPPNRLPLAEGRERWLAYLSYVASLPGDRLAMIEFVRGDSLEQFTADAAVLHDLLRAVSKAASTIHAP
jgi:sugar phosphate isomerase/epimerase